MLMKECPFGNQDLLVLDNFIIILLIGSYEQLVCNVAVNNDTSEAR